MSDVEKMNRPDAETPAEKLAPIAEAAAAPDDVVTTEPESRDAKPMQVVIPPTSAPPAPTLPHPPRPGLLIFAPHRLVERVTEIKPEELAGRGIRGVILDLDNTLVLWQKEELTDEVTVWLAALKAAGLTLCIMSNSVISSRSERIAGRIGGVFIKRARKPSRQGFRRAMELMQTAPITTAIVGDQMFTDIWGGNRAGIYTIMVKPIHPREFAYTRYVSRPPERWLLNWFKKRGYL